MNSTVCVVQLSTTKIQKKHLSENLEIMRHSASIRSISTCGTRPLLSSSRQWQQHPHVRESSSPGDPVIPSVNEIISDCRLLLHVPFLPWLQPWRTSNSFGGRKSGYSLEETSINQRGGLCPESFLAYRLVVMTPITKATVTINIVVAKNIPTNKKTHNNFLD